MASSPLTLAALATSAVPGLTVSAVRGHSLSGNGDFSAAVISGDERRLIVRVPKTPGAEVLQSAEMLGLATLAEGARSQLPFEVPETLGMTRAGDTRAVVSTFIDGGTIDLVDLEHDAILLQPIAEALAAIHQLPTSLVQQSGLTVRSADEVRQAAARLVARAADTRLLPDTVHSRWLETLDSTRFWDFAPTVVHGSFDVDRLLITSDTISGVLGWSELSVGDPAVDLAWLLAGTRGVFETVLARYTQHRGAGGSTELAARARFHHELEVAKWLLHGVDSHDQQTIDDAVSMLDRLVDRLTKLGQAPPEHRVASAATVQQLLEDLPETPADPRSETAEYEALDEDRAFEVDRDFSDDREPDADPDSNGQTADPDQSGVAADAPAAEDDEEDLGPTQPIDPEDLPVTDRADGDER